MTYRIPKPEWDFKFDYESGTASVAPYFEEVANGLTRKTWEIEEEMLTGAVVDLLRSKGWKVVRPNE